MVRAIPKRERRPLPIRIHVGEKRDSTFSLWYVFLVNFEERPLCHARPSHIHEGFKVMNTPVHTSSSSPPSVHGFIVLFCALLLYIDNFTSYRGCDAQAFLSAYNSLTSYCSLSTSLSIFCSVPYTHFPFCHSCFWF